MTRLTEAAALLAAPLATLLAVVVAVFVPPATAELTTWLATAAEVHVERVCAEPVRAGSAVWTTSLITTGRLRFHSEMHPPRPSLLGTGCHLAIGWRQHYATEGAHAWPGSIRIVGASWACAGTTPS